MMFQSLIKKAVNRKHISVNTTIARFENSFFPGYKTPRI